MSINKFISDYLVTADYRSGYLLQCLYEIQYQYACIPQQAIKLLAEKLSLSEAHIHVGYHEERRKSR